MYRLLKHALTTAFAIVLWVPPGQVLAQEEINIVADVLQVEDVGQIEFNEDIGFTGVAVTPTHVVFSDTENDQVLSVFQTGGSASVLSLEISDVPVVFFEPAGLKFGEGEEEETVVLYIADYGNDRVIYTDFSDIDDDGFYEASEIAGSIGLNGPTGLAVDDTDLYISDSVSSARRWFNWSTKSSRPGVIQSCGTVTTARGTALPAGSTYTG